MLNGIIIPSEVIQGVAGKNSLFPFERCPENWKKDIHELGPWNLESFDSGSVSFKYHFASNPELNQPVFVFEECSSVLDLVLQLKKTELVGDWGSVISISQTEGRGSLGRKWVSTPGNIHAAIKFPDIQEDFSCLAAMMVSVILIDYLRSYGIQANLKWPNDIVLHEKKIAGILVEKKQYGYVVGIGINLCGNPPVSELRENFVFPAGIVPFPEITGGPLKIWIDIVRLLIRKIYEFVYFLKLPGFISLVDGILLWKGKYVRISGISEDDITGTISGIGKTGGLIICESGREKEIFSGTVVRLNNG